MSTNAQDTSQVIGSLIGYYPESVLYTLLKDRTTHRGIIWADNSYAAFQSGFGFSDSITPLRILNRRTGKFNNLIHLRATKKIDSKSQRTRSHAEVFSPSWLVNRMNNALDRIWFGRDNVFTTPTADGRKWKATSGRISFPQGGKNDQKGENKSWSAYVTSPRLEIACGEAPFLCSRYDVTTGEPIAVPERIGILDRKLRVVSENTSSPQDWDMWALKALQATYGYEYQGDNLLIARVNVLETLVEHREDRWGEKPDKTLMSKAARIVSWNLWQMDGLTDSVPAKKQAKSIPMDIPDNTTSSSQENTVSSRLSKIYDWQQNKTLTFRSLKRQGGTGAMKKFYAVIGNPPYNEDFDNSGDNGKFAKPVYHKFMDEAYKVGEKVELITPARFLFNAGATPKAWNKKMLEDPHLKVLSYDSTSSNVFPNVDIKGGVAVTYRDESADFGAIQMFTPYPELQNIRKKVVAKGEQPLSTIIYAPESYHFTNTMHKDHPEIRYVDKHHGLLSKGHDYDLKTSVISKLDGIVFFKDKPSDGHNYVQILGRMNDHRLLMYIRREYINGADNFHQWKVILAEANGTGALGEPLSHPLVVGPAIGHTQSFISMGSFNDKKSADALLKYVKTKFARIMLSILKTTQHNDRGVWRYVPLQDFTANSDIDWSQSIHDIDKQLYRKYGLTDEEQKFIETHVKEMD